MPSIVPSYIYTIFASIVVGALVICACGASTLNLRTEVEKQQLLNVAEYIFTESMALISQAKAGNVSSSVRLHVPSLIGDKNYWIRISNNSASAWVEAGFGVVATSSERRVCIPAEVSASGSYISSSGIATLTCHANASGVYLTLSGGN
ncbi:MAG: hypothetical protein QW166_01720 [Candidatus Bathyarchaeia archaeon]